MKDLKHYFSSPGGSDNEVLNGNNGTVSKKRRYKSVTDNVEFSPECHIVTKKKRKKKNNFNESEQDKYSEKHSSKTQKKRKENPEERSTKKPRVSKLCENVNKLQKTEGFEKEKFNSKHRNAVDSSKENSMNSSSECDEKSLDTSNNLHNYFNKVDKLPDISFKPHVLQVEAVVHYPPSEQVKLTKRLKTKLRRRKSVDLRPEYDIITSEEDNASFINSASEFCIDIPSSLEDINNSEEIFTSPESLKESKINHSFCPTICGETCESSGAENINKTNNYPPSKVKSDGTLNSFFKISSRMVESSVLDIDTEERKIARQHFLNSGVPERMRKQLNNKKQETVLLDPAPYPKYNHITQADLLSVIWNLKIVKLKLKNSNTSLINLPSWSSVTKEQSSLDRNYYKNEQSNPVQEKKIINKIKKEIIGYPVAKWYTELLKMKNANMYEMWSEKYKPNSSVHLLGNTKNVEKLKYWLKMLNSNKNNSKKGNVSYCSEDEFVKSEDESELYLKNTVFLQGPPGSGKTATVYALAEEIGYKILEINSTCNRMGKKILQEFSEALQSHKVETNVINICQKRNKVEETKKSLILIEDVDVIFNDYDEGFISTIATLAATSKRPIILTFNEYRPKNFTKIIPLMHFKLDFEPFPQKMLCSWIRTVAAVEGIFLDEHRAYEVVNWTNGDIRKLLLQLQFSFVNSPEVICTENRLQTNNSWQNMSEQRIDILDETKRTANLCNLLTVCDILGGGINNQSIKDVAFNHPWHSIFKDSSELIQPNEATDHLTRDMLADAVQILNERMSFSQKIKYFSRCQSVIAVIERDVISHSSTLSHTSVATDYLPALRSMARSEIKRLEAHSKRNNRYFSYLQSIGITENTIDISNILSESLNASF